MPTVGLVNQPFGSGPNRIGDHLVQLLSRQTNRFDTVYMAVAFAKSSGISILFDHLSDFVSDGGTIEAVIGVDHQGTSRQGLELLLNTGAKVHVFHNPGVQTFHPKLYLFERKGHEGIALVGSNNLTRGGLYENFEFSVRLDHDLTVPEDARKYQELIGSFRVFTELSPGMSLRLDQGLLVKLEQEGYVLDETQVHPGAGDRRTPTQGAEGGLFRRSPMPRGPRPSLRVTKPALPQQLSEAIATFNMSLGARDTRQQSGYSRDIFIPIAARDANTAFWGWPEEFVPPATSVSGSYLERRVNILATPVNGPRQLLTQVRLYSYAQRSEFRLNCGELVRGATPGDVLVISSIPPGSDHDYEATVISQSHPMFASFSHTCVNTVNGSTRRWGYA